MQTVLWSGFWYVIDILWSFLLRVQSAQSIPCCLLEGGAHAQSASNYSRVPLIFVNRGLPRTHLIG
jgi:hypothetical protein